MQSRNLAVISILPALLLLLGGECMSQNSPVADQTITVKGDAVYVLLNIKNTTNQPIFLESLPAIRERTLGPEFKLLLDGREIPFVGAIAKRKPYTKSDFYELGSGDKLSRKIRIDLDYDFLSGNHRYEISYIYLTYNQAAEKVEANYSAETTFEYAR
jgi:hypothetical protein